MSLRNKVKFLIEHGVKISFLADLMRCHPTTLKNWVDGANINPRTESFIELGLESFLKDICKIMGD